MNDQDRSNTPARERRERRKTQILMSICIVFGLLVLTFVAMLITDLATGIDGRLPDADDPAVDAPTEPAAPTEPEEPDAPVEPDVPSDPLFTTVSYPAAAIHEGPLVLVNTTHVYTFPATNAHMVNIYNELVNAKTYGMYYAPVSSQLLMERTAYQAMDKMLTAFCEQAGLSGNAVIVADAYRSSEQQAAMNSATGAGYSDHHTGLLCTLNAGGSELKNVAPYDWIYQNCHKYGFVVRYPADKAAITGVSNYEECFRYVGAAHAYAMKSADMCLEEYLTSLRAYTKEAPLTVQTEDGTSYEIYYVASVGAETAIPVPTDATYTVSGDNEGGFIVTVKRS